MNLKKNKFQDLPSVNDVLLEIDDSILVHDSYLKYLIRSEINKFRVQIE